MNDRGLALACLLTLGAATVTVSPTAAAAQSVAAGETAAAAAEAAADPQAQLPPPLAPPVPPPPLVIVPPAPDRPFTQLFHNFVRDAKRLPSVETALTLGIGGGLALAVHPADDDVYEHATAGGPRPFYELGSTLGDGWAQVGFAVGSYGTGLIAKNRELTHFGSDLIRAQVLNVVVTQGVKFSVQRERPEGSSGHSYSFPSGHTSSAFATAAVVWRHYGWKAGVPASFVGAWVGASRVQLGKHYLSDVVFGAAVGVASGRSVTIGHGRSRLALAPAAVPGGAALMFTLVER
jgi:membrane-associated phospholipid phosphatase